MKKTLTIVILGLSAMGVFAEGAADPIVGKWRYKATVLEFMADGSVDASYDDKTYRKWEKVKDVDRAYYMTIPGNKYDIFISKDGKSFEMPAKKRVFEFVDPNAKKKKRPKSKWQFFLKVIQNNVEEADAILTDYPELINETERGNVTVLHKATSKEMIDVLLSHNGNINATNSYAETPLHCAYENERLTKILLDCGADAHLRNRKSQTPLEKAISHQQLHVAEVILAHENGKPRNEKEWNRVWQYAAKQNLQAKVLVKKYRYEPEKKKKEPAKPKYSKATQELLKTFDELVGGKFKILEAKLVDKKEILRYEKRSEKSLATQTQWEELPLLVRVTFEVEIPDAEPGKVSTFAIKEIYLQTGRRKYPFVGLKLKQHEFYQGPGITFHSDENGKFAQPEKATMYFLVPPPAQKAKLVFKKIIVAESQIKAPPGMIF